jgi:hypothetical protein
MNIHDIRRGGAANADGCMAHFVHSPVHRRPGAENAQRRYWKGERSRGSRKLRISAANGSMLAAEAGITPVQSDGFTNSPEELRRATVAASERRRSFKLLDPKRAEADRPGIPCPNPVADDPKPEEGARPLPRARLRRPFPSRALEALRNYSLPFNLIHIIASISLRLQAAFQFKYLIKL